MSSQIQITGETKVKSLTGVLVGTSGVVSSLNIDGSLGIPQLDVNGKILVSQLPNSVMEYKGTWDASTNTPTLVNGTGNQGDVYLCSVAGTVNFGAGAIAFVVSDQVIYSGSIWQKASGTNGTVTSVGLSTNAGAITIGSSPITTSGTITANFNGTNLQYVNGAGNLTTFPTLITSIGLSMPSAFSVANSPLTANGTIAVTGAGYASQYIRGDGTLADFPSSGGGGSSVSYYLNGGTSQGTIGGTTYYEMSKTADTGTGVDFTKSGDGFIVAFLTDANDPAQLNIPAGNWNYEIYASMSANGGTPQMYAELYKYDGTTFTLISTSSNEILYDGTNLNLYTFGMTVPATTLTLTDRLAIKLYATNSGGKTTTVHTQDSHLCQVITTFSTGITALNGLTAQVQYFQVGTSGTDFNISSTTATHTFNIPDASATARGLITTGTQTIAGTKTFSDATKNNGGIFLQNASSSSLAGYMNIGGLTNGVKFTSGGGVSNTFTLPSATGYTFTFPNATGTIALTSDIPTNPVGGTGTINTLPKFTAASTIGNSNITDTGSLITLGINARISGSIGIGVDPLNWVSIRANKNITGNLTSTGISQAGAVQSDVSTGRGIINALLTQAASFTLTEYFHFLATQGTIGAGSSVTSQIGYYVDNTLTGATNNYGFYGNIASGTNRWNLFMNGTANNYLEGALGIGATGLTGYSLRLSKTITGATSANGVFLDSTILSDVTNSAVGYTSFLSTQAATFTLGNLYHYYAVQNTFGAGSTILNQYGFLVASNLIGATNNYGFRGQIPSGANRWNIYMDGTASNYMAGSLGIGTTSLTGYNLRIAKTLTGAVTSYGISSEGVIQSDATTNGWYYNSTASTAAASFTVGNIVHYFAQQGTFGAGSSVTRQYGVFIAANLTGATNNYGLYSDIPSGTNRWNLYMSGTAANYLAGQLLIGTTTIAAFTANSLLDVNGDARVSNYLYYKLFGTSANYYRVGILAGTANFEIYNTNNARTDLSITQSTGSVGIGTTSPSTYSLAVGKNMTGGTVVYGIGSYGTIQSDVTSGANGFITALITAAASFTLTNYRHFYANQGTIGAGSVVTNQTAFFVDSNVIGATNNYAFRSIIPSGTNRWNIYMDGTAANYMAGNLGIGTTVIETKLDIDISNTSTSVAFGNSIKLENTDTTVGNLSSLMLSQSGDAAATIAGIHTSRTPGSRTSDLGLYSYQQSGSGITERVRIKSTGQMRFVPLTADPSGAQAGDVYYNSTISALKLYDGTVWRTITVI